jgi:hypothetical protein
VGFFLPLSSSFAVDTHCISRRRRDKDRPSDRQPGCRGRDYSLPAALACGKAFDDRLDYYLDQIVAESESGRTPTKRKN